MAYFTLESEEEQPATKRQTPEEMAARIKQWVAGRPTVEGR